MTMGDGAAGKRVGRTPEARVRWLLRLAAQNLARLSPTAQRTAWDGLFAIQSRQPVRVPLHTRTLVKTHQALRACIEALANGRAYQLLVPEMTWTLRPPSRRPVGARHSGPVVRESAEAEVMQAAMPAMVVLAFVDDLNSVDADRLRSCPLETDGVRCGATFLGTRGQRFCTRRHAQAAAWQAYVSRGGAIERKRRRKGCPAGRHRPCGACSTTSSIAAL
jgi:hypothetical protein